MAFPVPDPNFNDSDSVKADADEPLIIDVEGYEGPLDVLLQLARNQKVDLTKISILALAEQYLTFIQAARRMHLELAADYLVMAAWLAYLKSRLLLPDSKGDDSEPTAEEMAGRLQLQLTRLDAMRQAAARLMARARLGVVTFGRGAPEMVRVETRRQYADTLYDLLKAYGTQRNRITPAALRLPKPAFYAIEDARHRLERMLGLLISWNSLDALIPLMAPDPLARRSATASMLAATLEMARDGQIEITQNGAFAPVYLKQRPGAGREDQAAQE